MSESMSELEKDIEASRARLDDTIDRIQGRLTPANLVEEMLGSARGTTLNTTYDGALEAIRRNPIPVLLIAAGVGMLLRRMATQPRHVAIEPTVPVTVPPMTERIYDPDLPAGHPVRDVADVPRY